MSNTIDKMRHPGRTEGTSHTASTSHSASTGATASTHHAPHGAADRDKLEEAARGRRWFEEVHGRHVQGTGSTVTNPDFESIRAVDLQDQRKKA